MVVSHVVHNLILDSNKLFLETLQMLLKSEFHLKLSLKKKFLRKQRKKRNRNCSHEEVFDS